MPVGSGLKSQIGFAIETTPGTRVTPTRFLEYTQESLKLTKNRIESRGIRAGRRTMHRWGTGTREVTGGVTVELAPQGLGMLLKAAIGAVSTAGTNPYTHTFTPGDLDDKTMTIQVNRPYLDGTDEAFDYVGCSIVDWSLDAQVNAFLMGTFNVYGMDEDTSQSLAAASYPTGLTPFTFIDGALTVAGSAQDIKQLQISGNNAMATGRHQITATSPGRPKQAKEAGQRDLGGSFVIDWTSLTQYNRFVNGTEASFSMLFNAGASAQLTIAGNVRFDGETPVVPGAQLLEHPCPFKFTSATSDAAAFTATLVNADATP